MRKLKVGDKIRHTLFGGEQLTGVVEEIQICRKGEKEGRSVNSCDIKKHHGVVDVSDGHWCYLDQIIEILD